MAKYATGKHSKEISDRSGMEFPYSEMVKEWNGSFVHYSEFEPKQPQIRRRRITADAIALQSPRSMKFQQPTQEFLADQDATISDSGGASVGVANLSLPGQFAFRTQEFPVIRNGITTIMNSMIPEDPSIQNIRRQEEGLEKIFKLECDLIPLLIEMRWKGVRVDLDRAEQVAETLSKKEQQLLVEFKRKFGITVEIWANASIQKAFEANDIWYPRTEKGMASFQAPWLEAHEHPLPKMIVQARKWNKARTTFVEKMILGHQVDGRIHAEAHPLRNDSGGTVSGRFSYTNPNLQQVPARDPELGKLIRSLFIPEQDAIWGAFDYSQQEPRLTVHYASKMNLRGSEDAVKAYSEEGADFHQIVADMA